MMAIAYPGIALYLFKIQISIFEVFLNIPWRSVPATNWISPGVQQSPMYNQRETILASFLKNYFSSYMYIVKSNL